MAVPPASVSSLVQAARERGTSWPDRLRVPLDTLFRALPLTVELFLVQRPGMTSDEIDRAVSGYLTRRKARGYPRCGVIEWRWVLLRSAQDRAALEQALGLDTGRLFARAGVQPLAGAGAPQHLLLAYVCVPAGVQRYLRADPALTAPLLPSPQLAVPTRLDTVPAMPALQARTDPQDELHLRADPREDATSLGVLAGHAGRVTILDKASSRRRDGSALRWYKVRLDEPLSVSKAPVSNGNVQRFLLPTGQEAWLSSGGIAIAAAPWDAFRRDLRAWEAALPFLTPLGQRITSLRQRSHSSDLPFDEVLGTSPGVVYQDHLASEPGSWQMFVDYDAVVAPDGRWVDLQHLFVGLDALARPERRVTVRRYLVSFDVGTNWAAATWAGDLGSAVADSLTMPTGAWDSYAGPRAGVDRTGFFIQARAAEWDLLGYLDAWGAVAIPTERGDVQSVDDWLALYYEDLVEPTIDVDATSRRTQRIAMIPSIRRRADALHRFLLHYGFTFPQHDSVPSTPRDVWRQVIDNVRVLEGQRAAQRIRREIGDFTQVWLARRMGAGYVTAHRDDPRLGLVLDEVTRSFLYWLEQEAIWHDVETRQVMP